MRTILLAAWAIGLSAISTECFAQEWTRFRGPNGTGECETSLPAEWTEKDYRWVVDLPGRGNSSPVLWGSKLFLLSADPETATRYVICLDAILGKVIWQREFESSRHHLHKMSSYASCTPTVDDERVYVAWSTPASLIFMALDHEGNTLWQKDLGRWYSQHGFGASPMLFDDLVILSNSQEAKDGPKEADVTPDSFLMAFERKTGKEVWRLKRKTDHITYSVPAVFQPKAGPPQLVNTGTASGMYAVDPLSGKELWSTVVFDKRTVSSPLVKGDMIVGSTGSGNGGNYVAAVRCDGQHPEVAYQVKIQAPYVPSVVAKDNLLFLINDQGIAACVDLQTGEPYWRKRIAGNYQSSPVRAADKVYCVSTDGDVVVLAAEKEFQELGRTSLGEGTRATPAIALGQIYFRTFSKLMALGQKPLAKQPDDGHESNSN